MINDTGESPGSYPGALVPQPHGGKLKRGGRHYGPGRGAKRGRPSTAERDELTDAMQMPACQQAIRAILSNPDHRHFATIWVAVRDRVYGKPTEKIEHSGGFAATVEHVPLKVILPELDVPPV